MRSYLTRQRSVIDAYLENAGDRLVSAPELARELKEKGVIPTRDIFFFNRSITSTGRRESMNLSSPSALVTTDIRQRGY